MPNSLGDFRIKIRSTTPDKSGSYNRRAESVAPYPFINFSPSFERVISSSAEAAST